MLTSFHQLPASVTEVQYEYGAEDVGGCHPTSFSLRPYDVCHTWQIRISRHLLETPTGRTQVIPEINKFKPCKQKNRML